MQVECDLSTHSYAFAVPCYEGKLQAETCLSLLSVSGRLTSMGVKHAFLMIRGGALIDAVRNELVRRFQEETDCDTMIWVDADIEFTWEAFERLAVYSHLHPIVCGVYCGRLDPPTFTINPLENKLTEEGLLPIEGTGFGFVAVQRGVFEKIPYTEYYDDKAGLRRKAYFRTTIEDDKYIGEDVYFFRQAVKAGYIPMADPGIELKHHGSKVYDTTFSSAISKLLGEGNGVQTV